MERVVDVENMDDGLRLACRIAKRLDLVSRTGNRDRVRCIDGGDADLVQTMGLCEGKRRLLVHHSGSHLALAGKQILRLGALGDDRHGFRSGQGLGGIGSCNFAHGVAEDDIRANPEISEAIRDGSLDRKQHRLSDLGIGKPTADIVGKQQIRELFAQVILEQRAEGLEALAEMAAFTIGLNTHSSPLRTIAGKHESCLAGMGRRFSALPLRSRSGQMRFDRLENPALVLGFDGEAITHRVAIGAGGGDHPTCLDSIGAFEGRLVVFQKRLQGGGAMGAGKEELAVGLGGQRRRVDRIGIADHDVGVGAAEAERVDAGEPSALGRHQLHRGHVDPHVERGEVDILVGFFDMQRRGQEIVFQRDHRLDETEKTRHRLGMADIRLDRTDRQRGRTVLPDDSANGPDFRRVAHTRSRAVAFDKGDAVHVDAVALIDRAQKIGLRFPRWQTDAVGAARRIHACCVDLGVAAVIFPLRAIAATKDDRHPAFGADIAMAVGVISTAKPFGRQHARLREADEGERVDQDIDAADDRGVDITALERAHRLIQRHQRRRAGGVDGHARPIEAEDVRNAVRDDRERVARHEIRAAGCRILRRQRTVFETGRADINADLFLGERACRKIGVFQRLPDQCQKHALLRVHLHGLALRNAENGRIEVIQPVDNACGKRIGLSSDTLCRMPETCQVPSISRDLRNGATAAAQDRLEFLDGACTRRHTGSTNNFDRHCHSVFTAKMADAECPHRTTLTTYLLADVTRKANTHMAQGGFRGSQKAQSYCINKPLHNLPPVYTSMGWIARYLTATINHTVNRKRHHACKWS